MPFFSRKHLAETDKDHDAPPWKRLCMDILRMMLEMIPFVPSFPVSTTTAYFRQWTYGTFKVAHSPMLSITEVSITETPIAETSIAVAPIAETLIIEAPIAETPIAETSIAVAPIAETSIADTSIAETSIAETQSVKLVMPSLFGLPIELVILIAKSLGLNDLCALIFICKTFQNALAQECIEHFTSISPGSYQVVSGIYPALSGWRRSPTFETPKTLSCMFSDNPTTSYGEFRHLATFLESLDTDTTLNSLKIYFDGRNRSGLFLIIRALTSVQCKGLTIRAPIHFVSRQNEQQWPLVEPEMKPFPQLDTITCFDSSSACTFSTHMILWTIKVLHASPIRELRLSNDTFSSSDWSRFLSMLELPHLSNLYLDSHLSRVVVTKFLHRHPSLRFVSFGDSLLHWFGNSLLRTRSSNIIHLPHMIYLSGPLSQIRHIFHLLSSTSPVSLDISSQGHGLETLDSQTDLNILFQAISCNGVNGFTVHVHDTNELNTLVELAEGDTGSMVHNALGMIRELVVNCRLFSDASFVSSISSEKHIY